MGPGAMTQVMQLTKNLSTSLVVILTIVLFGCGGTSDDAESLNLPITPASGSYAVAIDGDIIVIGAEVDSVDGEDAGGAYIYRLQNPLNSGFKKPLPKSFKIPWPIFCFR